MQPILERAKAAGFDKAFLRRIVLPDWWNDEIASTPAGLAQATAIISRHTGLDFESLRSGDMPRFRESSCRFKRAKDTAETHLEIAKALGVQLARFAALGVQAPVRDVPADGAAIRTAVRKTVPAVNLESLVAFCWQHGVMVLHFSELPKGAKKMHAMATIVGGRPAIIVCRRASEAHLLFDVAHELGHLALGHVGEEASLVDENIDQDSDDGEEQAANSFALCVITGGPTRIGLLPSTRWPSSTALANAARKMGAHHGVDPGHIVLNYAHTMASRGTGSPEAFWGTAHSALKSLGVRKDGAALIRAATSGRVDWDALPDDARGFATRLLVDP